MMNNKKLLRFDKKVNQEIEQFPINAKAKLKTFLKMLARDGKLIEPHGKKISRDLFEIRIKESGQWRVIYAYSQKESIMVLLAFRKKTQRTPLPILKKATARLRKYKDL